MVGSSKPRRPLAAESARPPLRLVAVTHGSPSPANRAAVIRLVDAVATARPELEVSISFVDARSTDVAAAVAGEAAAPGAAIVPLVLFGRLPRAHRTRARPRPHRRRERPRPRAGSRPAHRRRCSPSASKRSTSPSATPSSSPLPARTTRVRCASASRRARLLAQRLSRACHGRVHRRGTPAASDAIEMVREAAPRRSHRRRRLPARAGAFYDTAAGLGGDVSPIPLLLPDRAAPAPLVDLVLDRYAAVELVHGGSA